MIYISVILTVLISYIITSAVLKDNTKYNLFLIYMLLFSFAQTVLSFEILSLFNEINRENYISLSLLLLLISIAVLKLRKAKLYIPDIKTESSYILRTLKTDKIILTLSVMFIFFIISQLVMIFVSSVVFGDALTYYLPRSLHWLQNANLNHYITYDVRELIMPINMDILYSWHFLFAETERGCSIYSFLCYINAIWVLYHFLGELNIIRKRRLWAIYVFSGFSIIGLMAHMPCGDLFIGSLILTAIYLFLLYCKYNKMSYLYLSTLVYALSIGTKTTTLFTLIGVFFLFIVIHKAYSKNNIVKSALIYILFLLINFAIFSSYNYILNYLQFGNFLTNKTHILLNQFRGGFKGFIFNLINYIFFMFDLSGININGYNEFIMALKEKVLTTLCGDPSQYLSPFYAEKYEFSSDFNAVYSSLGPLGLLTFYPSILYCMFKIKTKKKSRLILSSLAFLFIINTIIIAASMIFTKFNMRYIVTFVVISAPILSLTYFKSPKNIYKWVVAFFLFMYIYTYAEATSDFFIFHKYKSPSDHSAEEMIYKYFSGEPPYKIGVIAPKKDSGILPIEKLRLKGHKIDILLVENIRTYDLDYYDYIIATKEKYQKSSYVVYDTFDVKNYASICHYLDKDLTEIVVYDGADLSGTTKVYCEIPNIYIKYKGFEPYKKLIVYDYEIYKRKN